MFPLDATVMAWRRLYSASLAISSFCTSRWEGMPPVLVQISFWASLLPITQLISSRAAFFASAGLFRGTDQNQPSAQATPPRLLWGPAGKPAKPTLSGIFDFSGLR